MLCSVFTPTNDFTFLNDLYLCLKNQTYKSWEWVLVPNGENYGAIIEAIEEMVKGDERVRVVAFSGEVRGIGQLKRFACEQCAGELLAEADHDDLITPDCLQSLVNELNPNSSPTFLYSDCVTTRGGKDELYSTDYGWKYYTAEVIGEYHKVNQTHPVTARSLCDIIFTPDHIRAWTRKAYDMSGGYNDSLEIADDHDLVVRTYLAGVEFKFIPRPLYVHRLTSESTSQKKLDKIREISDQTRNLHLNSLVKEWCRREGLPMIDLGGAHNSPPGFIPLDPYLPEGKGYKCDVFELESLIPDNSVGAFRASDFLEHIPPHKVIPLMNLLYRKLVPSGFVLSNTPAVCDEEGRVGRGATQDPTHLSFWSSNSFWYYSDKNYSKYIPEFKGRFQTVQVSTYYPSDWHKTHLIPYTLWNSCALKNDDTIYFPGIKNI